jgi:hypothetical protein
MRVAHPEIEEAKVAAWRRRQLIDAGFSMSLAASVAADARYDLHALIELTERGCTPELALRILAPFEAESEAA